MQSVILMPVYEDRESFEILLDELKVALKKNFYIVAVDDGSIKDPINSDMLKSRGIKGAVIKLKRNLGHQRAIALGISYVAEHFPDANCVVMDSDGEDTPASVKALLDSIQKSEEEVIVAARKSRIESLKFKTFYFFYKHVFSLFTGRAISFGNFMVLKPAATKRLAAMQELWVHVAACVLISRLRVKKELFDRGARYRGKSKMNFGGLVLHGFRAFMVFAEDVLVRVGVLCFIVAVATIIAIFTTIFLKSIGFATPGWFSIALGTLFLVLLQTGMITLVSLMLSGVMRQSGNLVDDYRPLILEVQKSNAAKSK